MKNDNHIQFSSNGRVESVQNYTASEMEEVFTAERRAKLAAGEVVRYTDKYKNKIEIVDLQAYFFAKEGK